MTGCQVFSHIFKVPIPNFLAFFLLVMTVAAPPFQRQVPVPADGRGLNPLLEDTGMITHPVALYLGFTGLTVPFAVVV